MPTWADPDRTQRMEAFRFFVGVGRVRMRRAIALARRGRVHPDPDVAAAALRWAHMVLACEPAHPEFDSSRLRRYRALLGEMTWVRGSYAEWLRDRSLRRSASLIIAAAEPGEHDAAMGGSALRDVSRAAARFPRRSTARLSAAHRSRPTAGVEDAAVGRGHQGCVDVEVVDGGVEGLGDADDGFDGRFRSGWPDWRRCWPARQAGPGTGMLWHASLRWCKLGMPADVSAGNGGLVAPTGSGEERGRVGRFCRALGGPRP